MVQFSNIHLSRSKFWPADPQGSNLYKNLEIFDQYTDFTARRVCIARTMSSQDVCLSV